MSKAASQYLREVKKRIPCSGSQKTEFLCQLEAEVLYYCEDHDNVDFSVLSACFGKPEDVAKDFLSELGESAAIEANSNRQKFFFIFLAIILFVIVGIAIHIGYVQHTLLDIQYIESITYEEDSNVYITGPTYALENGHSEEEIDIIPDSK